MKDFLAAIVAVASRSCRLLAAGAGLCFRWLSIPRNACVAALTLAFAVSALSWAIGDRNSEVALFFPSESGSLEGEMRALPRTWKAEARAELVVSELLLGPRNPESRVAFAKGARLSTALYRKGRLFVDISEDAALAERVDIERGLACLEKSLDLALPGMKSLTVTIGGREPFDGAEAAGNAPKKHKYN